jgi:thymidylate synthase
LESTGENVRALSVFGYQCRYDLAEGFPIVTTKKVSFKTLAHELIWFLSGDTNVKYLHDNNVHIWDEWVGEDGTIGDGYGKQWRRWRRYDNYYQLGDIDQIKKLIDGIKEVKENPLASVGRRLILSAWNVGELDNMNLLPCHCLAQFNVTDDKLSCHLYQRSADAFLGIPYNISSYALLTHLLANVTGLEVGEFIHSFGDLHIYENHLEQVNEQLTRTPFPLPTLKVCPFMKGSNPYLLSTMISDFTLVGYNCHPKLAGEVAV